MLDNHCTATRRLNEALQTLDTAIVSEDPAAALEALAGIERWTPGIRPEDPVLTTVMRSVRYAALELLVADSAALAAGLRTLRVVAAAAFTDPGKQAGLLSALGDIVLEQATRDGDRRLVDEAIVFGRAAAGVTGSEPVTRTIAHTMLASALRQRYRHDHDVAALDEAITVGRVALDINPAASNAATALCLDELADCLEERFEVTPDVSLLNEAVDARETAARLVADDSARLPGYQERWGATLVRRHRETGSAADIEQAVAALDAVVSATPRDDKAYPGRQSNLAAARCEAYKCGAGDQSYLDGAITALRAAVRACPPANPSRTLYLSNLGHSLLDLYVHNNDSAVLREAITLHQQSLADTSNHIGVIGDRPRRLNGLASALMLWYDRFDDLGALEQAIAALQDALAELRDRDPVRPECLSNLGVALSDRYYAPGGTPSHLAEAIAVLREAAELLPDDHPNRAAVLTNLGLALNHRQMLSAREAESEHVRKWAVRRATEQDTGEVPAHLAGLTADPPVDLADAEETVRLAHQALASLPPDHPSRTAKLIALGVALRDRYSLAKAEADRAEAVAVFAEAASDCHATPRLRARAGEWGAQLAADAGDWPAAAAGYRTAVDMLPLLTPRELGRDDQEHQLRAFPGVAGNAAAAVLRAGGEPLDAITLLEQGRGILLAQALGFDGSISALREGPAIDPSLAADGPVVAVNVSKYGCHGLITAADGARAVPLPGITARSVKVRSVAFRTALDIVTANEHASFAAEDRWAAARLLDQTLAWLWDNIAEPVLDVLGRNVSSPRGAELPRLWWMPTGMLSFLPLHAAGHHTTGDGRTLLDRVVSSYIPTLRALAHARARPVTSARPANPLVVAVSQSGGRADLPAALDEAKLIRRHLAHSRVLIDGQACRADVLDSLRSSDWVHFACHAHSDLDEPSASYLLLTDGPLTVRDIGQLRTARAQFAYLSACSTGRGGTELTDEAIHISSAFQIAGYPHVIATLWPIGDRTAAALADDIYTAFADPNTSPARALHTATRRLRDSHHGHHPALWAAHVHAGP